MTEGQADDLIMAIRALTDTIEQQGELTRRRLDELNRTMAEIARVLDAFQGDYRDQHTV